ncbi:MAG: biotin--[acetyl-CoA-carboxylase] ligase [Siphonobacter sp.]
MYKSHPDTLFIGQKINYLPSCHSTNDIVAMYLREDEPEGLVVITDEQTAGRGQRGNQWLARKGENLTFSTLLRPTFLRTDEQFQLSRAVSLAVYDLLSQYCPVKIKWPNDLYYNDKKLGGILIENTLMGSTITGSVIGIGLNINQSALEVPTATSLHQITGRYYALESLLMQFCQYLEGRYMQLRKEGDDRQRQEYLDYLYRYQEWHPYRDAKGQLFHALLTDVADNGQLMLQKADATFQYFDIKEVSFVIS